MLNTTELSIKRVNMEKFVMHCYHNKKLETFKKCKAYVLSDKTMKTIGI